MMEFLDTGLLGVILATVIYLVRKTTILCHDVEKLKKWVLMMIGYIAAIIILTVLTKWIAKNVTQKKKSGYSRFEPTAPTLIKPPNPSIKIDTKARISISIQ